jgi:CRISPR-associated exonuclease Cas4
LGDVLLGGIATALVATFSGALDELLEDFEAIKRNTAVLDFDDLLLAPRALVRSPNRPAGGVRPLHADPR